MFDASDRDPDSSPTARRLEARVALLEAQVAELRAAAGMPPGDREGVTTAPTTAATEQVRPESVPAAPAAPPRPTDDHETSPSIEQWIEQWFEDRGFQVQLAEDNPVDAVFDRLAEYLGDNFSDLERLFGGLRWSLRTGKSGSLKPQTAGERKHCLEFCQILHDRALLTDFYFNRNNGTLSYKANGDERFQRFLEGFWLERYVLGKSKQRVEAKTTDFSIARNLELKGPEGRFEMDVFLLVHGSPIWIECKSRKYQQHIERYVQRAEMLRIPLDHTLLVVQSFESKDAEKVAEDLHLMYGLSVTPTARFLSHLDPVLADILGGGEGDGDLASRLSKCLGDGQMSPHPEVREEILATLAAFPTERFPSTVRDLREWVREQVPPDMQPFVHPVLMAVRRGGGMIAGGGRPHTAMRLDVEIVSLASSEVEELEVLCRGAYEEAIRRKLPALAELPEFPGTLEGLVEAASPQRAT